MCKREAALPCALFTAPRRVRPAQGEKDRARPAPSPLCTRRDRQMGLEETAQPPVGTWGPVLGLCPFVITSSRPQPDLSPPEADHRNSKPLIHLNSHWLARVCEARGHRWVSHSRVMVRLANTHRCPLHGCQRTLLEFPSDFPPQAVYSYPCALFLKTGDYLTNAFTVPDIFI